jgi:hypothetical protein
MLHVIFVLPMIPAPTQIQRIGGFIKPEQNAHLQFAVINRK